MEDGVLEKWQITPFLLYKTKYLKHFVISPKAMRKKFQFLIN
jgi:hypothetical protein